MMTAEQIYARRKELRAKIMSTRQFGLWTLFGLAYVTLVIVSFVYVNPEWVLLFLLLGTVGFFFIGLWLYQQFAVWEERYLSQVPMSIAVPEDAPQGDDFDPFHDRDVPVYEPLIETTYESGLGPK